MYVAVFRPGTEVQMHIHHGRTGSAPMITKVQTAVPGVAARTHTETQTLSVKVISVSL